MEPSGYLHVPAALPAPIFFLQKRQHPRDVCLSGLACAEASEKKKITFPAEIRTPDSRTRSLVSILTVLHRLLLLRLAKPSTRLSNSSRVIIFVDVMNSYTPKFRAKQDYAKWRCKLIITIVPTDRPVQDLQRFFYLEERDRRKYSLLGI